MKTTLTLIAIITLCSCTLTKFTYQAKLVYPEPGRDLYYENDTFSVAFSIVQQGVGIDIYNKSQEAIRLNWDEISLSIAGTTYRVVHNQTGVTKINDVQPPTTIPPASHLQDVLMPADNVHIISTKYTVSAENSTFPGYNYGSKIITKQALALKGARVVISLPFYMRNVYVSRYYNIDITDVLTGRATLNEMGK